MKQVFLSTTTEFKEIETLEPGSWINLVNPSQSESMEIASAFNIDIADLRAPLDAEEMSRMTIEDEYTLIIVDVPIKEERNNQTYYVTIPLGIILTEEAIITTCLEELPLLDTFINRRLRNFYTFMRSRFIFQVFLDVTSSAGQFLDHALIGFQRGLEVDNGLFQLHQLNQLFITC